MGVNIKIPYLKCVPYSESVMEKFSFPAYSQVKEDGMRCSIKIESPESIVALSQIGRTYPRLDEHLKPDIEHIFSRWANMDPFVLDGELIAYNEEGPLPRAKSNGITNKLGHGTISNEELGMLRFVVWDVIPLDQFWEEEGKYCYDRRLDQLSRLVDGCQNIWICETKLVNSLQEAKEHFRECISRKLEGTILKEKTHFWKNKRLKSCVKFKEEHDCDLEIIDIQEGQGKYEDMMGALICETSCGKLRVGVGTGFTDAQRNQLWSRKWIGKVVRVKYNQISENETGKFSLFLPKFAGMRTDKNNADTLELVQREALV
ncbi:MAG TPA: hypothetical protein DEP37_01380 [Algoriphagus sp.]|nr:hypothetical protein [Algoriphagus sp.]